MNAAASIHSAGQPVGWPSYPQPLPTIYAIAAEHETTPEMARCYALGVHASAAGDELEPIICRKPAEAWFAAGWHDHQLGRVVV